MARLARLVIAGLPHHVTQRGNRRQQTFLGDGDYAAYLELMAAGCRERGVEIWAYCLMPSDVHLIAVPQSEDGLARAIGEAHGRYTRRINLRGKCRGYLWQGRFASFVTDEPHVLAAVRYREHGRTGRPLGNAMFVERLAREIGRILRPRERVTHRNDSSIHNRCVSPN